MGKENQRLQRGVQVDTSCQRVKRRGKMRHRCGAAAVEFAIVAPIFILLIIGLIELGRGFMVQQILTNASRVGARRAVTLNATESVVTDEVTGYAANVSVSNVTVNVTPNPATAAPGSEITVTATVNYNDVSWLAASWFLGGGTLTASSVMRKEGFN